MSPTAKKLNDCHKLHSYVAQLFNNASAVHCYTTIFSVIWFLESNITDSIENKITIIIYSTSQNGELSFLFDTEKIST